MKIHYVTTYSEGRINMTMDLECAEAILTILTDGIVEEAQSGINDYPEYVEKWKDLMDLAEEIGKAKKELNGVPEMAEVDHE